MKTLISQPTPQQESADASEAASLTILWDAAKDEPSEPMDAVDF